MLNVLIIIFREGFEAFLTVAIILAYLRKTGRDWLRPSVHAGIAVSIIASIALGWALQSVTSSLWEGITGIIASVLVATFVVQMWRAAPRMKKEMELRIETAASGGSRMLAMLAVFAFTVLMVTREGAEAALMLIQVRGYLSIFVGGMLGIAAAATMSWAWAHYGHRINIKRFFQVTGTFLLLFTLQILFFSIHELSEAGVLPNSEAIHTATEPYGPEGYYGRWLSLAMVGLCAVWLISVSIADRMREQHVPVKTRG